MLILFVASFNMEKENLNLLLKPPALYNMKGVIMICEDTFECLLKKLLLKVDFYTIKYNVARLMLLWNLSDLIFIEYQEKCHLSHYRHVFDLMSKLCMVYKTCRNRKVFKSLIIRKKQYHVFCIRTRIVSDTYIIRLYYCSTK